MTVYQATATGNWSTQTWSPVGTPGSGDTVDCAGYTVTIDQDVNLGAGSLVATNASAGGFVVTAARSITANVTATVRTVLTDSHTTGTVSITGNIAAGSAGSNARGVVKASTALLSVVGSVTGGGTAGSYGLYMSAGGATVEVTGNVVAGSVSSGYGIAVDYGTLTVTGNTTGGSATNSHGIYNVTNGVIVVNGTSTGGTGATSYGAYNSANGSLTVTEAIGNAFGPGSAVANSAAGVYGSATAGAVTRVMKATAGAYGQFPTAGAVKMLSDATNSHTWKDSAGGADIVLVP